MNEIYWITRLQYFNGFSIGLLVVSAIITIGLVLGCLTCSDSTEEFIESIKEYTKILRISVCTIVLGVLMLVFIPNTKDAMMIYGLGGTIDYIESNKTAQGLPDKFIQAVDKYLDNELQDEKENKK